MFAIKRIILEQFCYIVKCNVVIVMAHLGRRPNDVITFALTINERRMVDSPQDNIVNCEIIYN